VARSARERLARFRVREEVERESGSPGGGEDVGGDSLEKVDGETSKSSENADTMNENRNQAKRSKPDLPSFASKLKDTVTASIITVSQHGFFGSDDVDIDFDLDL
jgi:hypothetical protein